MAKLVLSFDGKTLSEHEISKQRITLGRKPQNDIRIDNLAVSGEHAAVVTYGHDSFLEDLDSTNGTVVNGALIKKHFLQNGDVIEVGKHRITYVAEGDELPNGAAEDAGGDFDKTMIIRKPMGGMPPPPPAEPAGDSGMSQTQAMPGPEAAPPPREEGPRAVLQVLTGTNAGRELALTKSLTSIGKPNVQVAVITRRPQGYFITHVQGKDFPIVNGERLDAQAHPLADHDVIELAGIKMEFFLKP